MRTLILLSMLTVMSAVAFAQEIIVVTQNQNFVSAEKQKEFFYVPKGLDASVGAKVANVNLKIQREGNKNSLAPTFYALWKQANTMGANAFFISEMNYSEEKKQYDINVELLLLKGDEIKAAQKLYPANLVVVFGDINTKKEDKGKNFNFNKEKHTVMPYQFVTYQNPIGEKVMVSTGGATNTRNSFKGEEGKLPVFLSLGGISVSSGGRDGVGGVGMSISSGNITHLDMNIGLFLMQVLSK
jgi:hypothetical protein